MIRRISLFIAGVSFVFAGAWFAGFNFDERGGFALMIYLFSLYFGGCAAFLLGE